MITEEQLNAEYGHVGRTFPTLQEAEAHAVKHSRSRIYRIFNHVGWDKVCTGYLVSIEPEAVPMKRFTGKVRPPQV